MPFCCNQTILQKMNVFWAPTIVVLFISICDMGNSIFPQIFLFEPPKAEVVSVIHGFPLLDIQYN